MNIGRLAIGTAMALALVFSGCAATGPANSKPGAQGNGPSGNARANPNFYFSQGGQPARMAFGSDGVLDVYLNNAPFQLGYNGRQMNLALAQAPITETSTDPKGFKASRLSGAMAGAREPDELLVYGGRDWRDGNSEFSDGSSAPAMPRSGYQHAYQINKVTFVRDPNTTLRGFRGVLHGFVLVYRQPERVDQDIVPIRLNFSGQG